MLSDISLAFGGQFTGLLLKYRSDAARFYRTLGDVLQNVKALDIEWNIF